MSSKDDRYSQMADFYTTGPYVQHSEQMADQFDEILSLFEVSGERVLDLACGEGTFAITISEMGYDVTGLDLSNSMLDKARTRSSETTSEVEFCQADARDFSFEESFDVVTCWFDSINHITEIEGVESTFENVYEALDPDGQFVFDIAPIRTMAQFAQSHSQEVVRNEPNRFEAYTDVEFDHEERLLEFTITGFEQDGESWSRFDEAHYERGYEIEDIEAALSSAGFSEVTITESLDSIQSPTKSSDRIYFAASK